MRTGGSAIGTVHSYEVGGLSMCLNANYLVVVAQRVPESPLVVELVCLWRVRVAPRSTALD